MSVMEMQELLDRPVTIAAVVRKDDAAKAREALGGNLSYAVRVGLAMVAGMSREEAIQHAKMVPGKRPKNSQEKVP